LDISGKTRFVAIFGDPIEHTLSPAMHNAAFDELGMDCRYVPFHVTPAGLGDAVRGLRSMGFAGANITVPHKERVMEFLDEVDPEASKVGAVNTVVNRDGVLKGYNTDGRGFIMSLHEDGGFDPKGRRVYICGAGGASRGVAFALINAGVRRVYLFDIDGERAGRLAADINTAFGRDAARTTPPDPAFIRASDLAVNCTPLGMHEGDPLPMSKDSFRSGQVVYDVVYNPTMTELLKTAKGAGATAVNGLGMLLYQGVIAFEHWFGVVPPAGVMRKALTGGM